RNGALVAGAAADASVEPELRVLAGSDLPGVAVAARWALDRLRGSGR
ncbi:MAG: hypothetical protein RJA59_1977, partial [Pseudomonadota bacterium]